MAEPLASFGGFEGFEAFEGQFRATEKKDLARQSPEPTVCATAPTVWHRAQSPQSSKCEVLERLKRPASRSWLLQPPVRQNYWWQVSGGLRGLKGSFGPLEKKDLAGQSPEPTVWQLRPQSGNCEVLARLISGPEKQGFGELRFHTFGGPRRRPCLRQSRGRRICHSLSMFVSKNVG